MEQCIGPLDKDKKKKQCIYILRIQRKKTLRKNMQFGADVDNYINKK